MLPQWIIEKKRDGLPLTGDEISWFISGYSAGSIPDYQMSALAMAICLRGMNACETLAMTMAMMNSGKIIKHPAGGRPVMDKHSTGGIGDKISLALAPLAAACGLAVPMISGRGLGITGGTLDKMESIPGYRVDVGENEFQRIVSDCGCSIIGQTSTLAPADRKLYALRDVTGTVPSIPLIVSSIMSKKLAAGLDGLVLDVKCGSGAFMKTSENAHSLAESLVSVGRAAGKKVGACITSMDEPLGRTVGNSLEVMEAIATLRGDGPADVVELTLNLCARMLVLSGLYESHNSAMQTLRARIESGEALQTFRRMVELHGGDVAAIDNPSRLPAGGNVVQVTAPVSGYVARADAGMIGQSCLLLGAGRIKVTDRIDHAVGMSAIKKVGERVSSGEPLALIHSNSNRDGALREAIDLASRAFRISSEPVAKSELILAEL